VRILDTYCSLSTGEDDGIFWSKIEFTYSLTLTPLYDTYRGGNLMLYYSWLDKPMTTESGNTGFCFPDHWGGIPGPASKCKPS